MQYQAATSDAFNPHACLHSHSLCFTPCRDKPEDVGYPPVEPTPQVKAAVSATGVALAEPEKKKPDILKELVDKVGGAKSLQQHLTLNMDGFRVLVAVVCEGIQGFIAPGLESFQDRQCHSRRCLQAIAEQGMESHYHQEAVGQGGWD